jgi:transcriptional regulator with XRE-family HTH domain/Zn-dependent peptidase ImmA (M78 family)
MTTKYPFQPDYAVPPGATLKETLEVKGISQTDLALRAGLAEKTVSQIINGVAPITYETAEKLELALGVPARYWNRREMNYRAALARVETAERMEAELDWLDEIPVKELRQRNLIDQDATGSELVRCVLKFFGVSTVAAWRDAWTKPQAKYRGQAAQERRPGYVAAWLRIGELQAEALETQPFDASEFNLALDAVRALTVAPASQWLKDVPALCAPAGVAVVFTKEIPTASLSGATRWLTKDKALIQLSLKYKSDDQLWHTMFHEAGHVLRHSKKQVFIEYGLNDSTEEEREANEFARDRLIPPIHAPRLPHLKNREQIRAFAASLRIAPGIVVGRLQHDKLVFQSAFNDLKRKLAWSS